MIDTPGHLPGHLNLLCRLSPHKWVCLAGDAFHDPRLLTGEKEIGEWGDEAGNTFCIHLDKEGARKSIQRLRKLQGQGQGQGEGVEVELVAAHDEGWLERNRDALLPGRIS